MSESFKDVEPDRVPLFRGMVRPPLRGGVHVNYLCIDLAAAAVPLAFCGFSWLAAILGTAAMVAVHTVGVLLTKWDVNFAEVWWRQAFQKDYYPASISGHRKPARLTKRKKFH